MAYVITLDVGTSSMRAIVYDDKGNIHFTAAREYHTDFIYPSMVEQDPVDWKNTSRETLQEAAAYCKEKGWLPEAIAITSQRASLIPVDQHGIPLRTAIMWQDKRTLKECDEIAAVVPAKNLYRKTGLRLSPYAVLPRIIWLRQNQPELFRKAHKLIGVQDYVLHTLTEQFKTDWTQASRTMLMDIRKFQWDPELLAIAGLTPDKLCELVPPGSVAGHITQEVAEITGLSQGLPVIISGGDQQNAAVALNVIAPGKAEANTGTGSFIIAYTDKPAFDRKSRVLCSASAVAGKWIIEASIFNSGAIFRWFKEQFCKDIASMDDVYRLMDEEASQSPVGANGVMMLPHFEGSAAPYWEPKAKGLFFNLSLGTKRGDMMRAILEGIAMEISDNISLLETISGTIEQVTIAGGMTKSNLFAQIQSDAFNVPLVRYKNSEASSLGATMVAMVSLGIYASVEEAVAGMLESDPDHFEPNLTNAGVYDTMLGRKHKLFYSLQQRDVYSCFMEPL